MKLKSALICILAVASASASSAPLPTQTLYAEVDDRWFIYVTDLSCVAYYDSDAGSTLRVSDRTDENRLYFSIVNPNWGQLDSRLGEGLMLSLGFPTLRRTHSTAASVIEFPNGERGYAGGHLSRDVIRMLASGGEMVVTIMPSSGVSSTVERVSLDRAAVAMNHLVECTTQHFSQ